MLITPVQYHNIEEWIKALRSEKFKQGQSKLLDHNDRYCCLGVKCIIDGMSKELLLNQSGRNEFTRLDTGFVIGHHIGFDDIFLFMKMNDNENYTFPKIADVLEFYLEVVRIESEVESELVLGSARATASESETLS